MNRRVLSVLNIPIILTGALLAIALQTSIFSISLLRFLEPQSCLLILIWFALRRGFTEGGIVCLILGHIMELHSGAPRGFFLSVFMALYLSIRLLDRYTVFSSLRNLLWLTFATTVVFELANFALLRWLDADPTVTGATAWLRLTWGFLGALLAALPRGAATALMGNWVYGWVQSLDRYCFSISGELEDSPWDPPSAGRPGEAA